MASRQVIHITPTVGHVSQISGLLRVRLAGPRCVVVVAGSPTIGSSSALRSIRQDVRSRLPKDPRDKAWWPVGGTPPGQAGVDMLITAVRYREGH